MKTNIKLRVTPEQSVEIQKICFANKVSWPGSDYTIKFISEPYILIDSKFTLHTKCTDCLYKEVDADLFIRTNGTCEESVELVNNLLNSKSKEDMFKQYGFEVPNFDCTILAKVKNDYVGYVIDNNNIEAVSWSLWGTCYTGLTYTPKHNLTPIKQPWYETCKYPVIVKTEDSNIFIIKDELQNYTEVTLKRLTPLSNEEIDQLKQDF